MFVSVGKVVIIFAAAPISIPARGTPFTLLLRVFALDVSAVGGSGGGPGLRLRRFLRRTQASGAVVAAVFHIVGLGERWNEGGASRDLADAAEDDLGAVVVELDGTVNFDDTAFEAADVADVFEIGREDYHREGTRHPVFAEVEEVDALDADFDAENPSADAPGFADVLAGFLNGDAVGGGRR
jgi:hypothetical protein